MGLGTLAGHYVAVLPALLITTVVALACAGTLRRAWWLRHHGLVAHARVLTAAVLDTNVEYPAKRMVSVAFRTGAGRDMTATIMFRAGWHTATSGDIIPVRYDPDDPENAMLDRDEHQGRQEIRSCVVGIMLAAPVAVLISAALLIETIRFAQ
jgi:hypothetical protein